MTPVFAFNNAWNECLFAVLLTGSTVQTVTATMSSFLTNEEAGWSSVAAAVILGMFWVIILTLLAQRRIIQGFSHGSVK